MRLIFLVLATFFFASCTHKIVRKGYGPVQASTTYCSPILARVLQNTDSLKAVGSIELKDTGFSSSCSEEQAIKILKNEACSLDAQIIHITEERRPDLKSTCYRCKATFYQDFGVKAPKIASDNFSDHEVKERVKEDHKNQFASYAVGIVVGVVVAVLLSMAMR